MTHHMEQIGNYVIELPNPRAMWGIRMAGDDEYISLHNTKTEGVSAIKKCQAADRRRNRST